MYNILLSRASQAHTFTQLFVVYIYIVVLNTHHFNTSWGTTVVSNYSFITEFWTLIPYTPQLKPIYT